MQIHTLGVDLGKTVFHLVGLNLRGEVVVRKKCSVATGRFAILCSDGEELESGWAKIAYIDGQDGRFHDRNRESITAKKAFNFAIA